MNPEQGAFPLTRVTDARTAEERAAEEAEMRAMADRYVKAREAVVEACGGRWKRGMPAASGEIDCPVCGVKQALRYCRSDYNGHIHMHCKTAECVWWVE